MSGIRNLHQAPIVMSRAHRNPLAVERNLDVLGPVSIIVRNPF